MSSKNGRAGCAKLSEIKSLPHYTMEVQYDEQPRTCDEALVLVTPATRANQEEMADKAYRLATPRVLDGLLLAQAGEDDLGADYTLVGMCVDKKLKDVLLHSPRSGSKRQSALVILTTVLGAGEFMLEWFVVFRWTSYPG